MELHYILLIAAAVCITVEIFVPGFIAGTMAIGLLFSAAGAAFGLNAAWIILLFIIGCIITMFTIRPVIIKLSGRNGGLRTNGDALIGRTGTVIEEVDADSGRIKIDGDIWQARSVTGDTIPVGSKVEIVGRESIIMSVKHAD